MICILYLSLINKMYFYVTILYKMLQYFKNSINLNFHTIFKSYNCIYDPI